MARRARNGTDDALERWACWCYEGKAAPSAGRSMLAKLIDNKGELFFGGATGSTEPVDSVEGLIESTVARMFSEDPMCADVLRLEHDAGFWEVAQRRGIAGYDPRGIDRFEKAEALGITLRTYRRRLKEARDKVEKALGVK